MKARRDAPHRSQLPPLKERTAIVSVADLGRTFIPRNMISESTSYKVYVKSDNAVHRSAQRHPQKYKLRHTAVAERTRKMFR